MKAMETNKTRRWLDEATHHLRNARISLAASSRPQQRTLTHCQDAASSALKGFLTHFQFPFNDSADLQFLLAHAKQIEPEAWGDAADRLASCENIEDQYLEDELAEVWDDANAIVGQVFAFLHEEVRQVD